MKDKDFSWLPGKDCMEPVCRYHSQHLEPRGDPAGSRGRLIYKNFNFSRFEFSLFEKDLTLVCGRLGL